MTGEQWRDERMLEWLESGPSDVPTDPLEAAVEYARAHPRRRWSWAGLRRVVMSQMHLQEVQPSPAPRRWGAAFAVVGVVVVAVAVIGGVSLLSRNGNDNAGGVVAPVATPTPSPTPAPSASRSALVDDTCTVATAAGNQFGRPGAVDGKGTDARFSDSVYPAFFLDDVLYIIDSRNNTIRTMTRDGMVSTLAGKAGEAGYVDGPADAARFNRPTAAAADGRGVIYVADTGNHVIRKITQDGMVSTLAGNAGKTGRRDGVGSAAQFIEPFSLAVDAAGNVYVGEVDGYTIRKITPDGTVTTLVGKAGEYRYGVDGPASEGGFGWPFWLGFDAQGVLHAVDVNKEYDESRLRTVAPDGTVTTAKADWQSAGQPGSAWYDPSGTVYVTSPLRGTVSKLTPDGTVTVIARNFMGPIGIVGDASGTLYVGQDDSPAIRTITCAVGGGFPTGRWSRPLPSGMTGVAEFRPDGTWTYTRDGESMSTGTYSTDAGTLTFLTDSGCSEQNAERGTYAWTYANGQLTFRRLDDQCLVGRVTTFDGNTWTRAE